MASKKPAHGARRLAHGARAHEGSVEFGARTLAHGARSLTHGARPLAHGAPKWTKKINVRAQSLAHSSVFLSFSLNIVSIKLIFSHLIKCDVLIQFH